MDGAAWCCRHAMALVRHLMSLQTPAYVGSRFGKDHDGLARQTLGTRTTASLVSY